MNIKAIIVGTILTALFAGQSAMAGRDTDQGVYAAEETPATDAGKVNYSISSESTISAELDAELFPQGEGQ